MLVFINYCKDESLAPVWTRTVISQTSSPWSGRCVNVFKRKHAVRVWTEYVREGLWRMCVIDM